MLLGLHCRLRLERMNEMGMMKAAPRDKHILPHLSWVLLTRLFGLTLPSRSRTSRIVNPPLRRVTNETSPIAMFVPTSRKFSTNDAPRLGFSPFFHQEGLGISHAPGLQSPFYSLYAPQLYSIGL